MRKKIKDFLQNETGATMIEYAVIASFIVIIFAAAANTLFTKVGTSFNNTTGKL